MSPAQPGGEDLFDSLAFPEPPQDGRGPWWPAAASALGVVLAALALWFARPAVESAGLAAWHLPVLMRALAAVVVLVVGAALLRRHRLGDAVLAAWLLAVAAVGLELTVGALPLTAAACIVLGTAPWRRA